MLNTNTSVATINVNGAGFALPKGTGLETRTSKAGKDIGTRVTFIGEKPLGVIRAEGKAHGLKGKKLQAFVEASFHGDAATAAWMRHGAVLEGVRKAGAVPIEMDTNKTGESFTFRFKVAGEAAKAEVAAKEAAAQQAKLDAAEAAVMELRAQLNALMAEKAAAK